MRRYDVAVVGAGPAGLAAAATAATAGCRVALLDLYARTGGQFWRHRPGADGSGHQAWRHYVRLAKVVDEWVDHLPGTEVWFAEPGVTLHTSRGPVSADRLVLATGTHDKVLPFPGWDLPGVVTAGGAQALLKGSGVPAGNQVVVAGAGPLLLPVAVQLAAAGARVAGVFEAGNPVSFAAHPLALAGAVGKLPEAARYAAALIRHGVSYRPRHAVVAAHGADRVVAVDVARLDGNGHARPGPVRRVPCDAVAVSHGFVAQVELALSLDCAVRSDTDGGPVVAVDTEQRTSVAGVYAAGEVTGVGGAALAVAEGILAGAAAATSLGRRNPLSRLQWTVERSRRSAYRRFAAAIHAVHRPPDGWPEWLTPQTPICRCEEVPLARLREAVEQLDAVDARAVKLFARPGMGNCQGRFCGTATACLTALLRQRPVALDDLVSLARRPIARPVRLDHLANPPDAGPTTATPDAAAGPVSTAPTPSPSTGPGRHPRTR